MRYMAALFCTAVWMLAGAAAHAADTASATIALNIEPQPVRTALKQLSDQAGVQVLLRVDNIPVDDMMAPKVSGELTVRAALDRLLANTGLTYEFVGDRAVRITRASRTGASDTRAAPARNAMHLALVDNDRSPASGPTGAGDPVPVTGDKGVPEILVKGKRTLNADIERTEDAPQPYVVFSREDIRNSQAVNLDEFLKTRLPMNTMGGNAALVTGSAYTNSSAINLRGLGANQTLLLVDGRRLPGVTTGGIPGASDINGIPMSAIERIEVLPSTAGGIYGGSATGGVINIILRRDFSGVETRATYGNTFDTDVANARLDLNAGFSLEGGRTRITLTAAYSRANSLTIGDRDFSARALALQLDNNPAAVASLSSPPLGATVNIRSVSGPLILDSRFGGTNLGSNITHVPLGYAGVESDQGRALVGNAGRYNLDTPGGVNGKARGLMAAPSMESASFNVRREFGSQVEAFLDLSSYGNFGRSPGGNVPSQVFSLRGDAPNNPFQQAINVRFPIPGLEYESRTQTRSLQANAGLILRLPRGWTAEADHGWSRSRFQLTNPGTLLNTAGSTSLRTGLPPSPTDSRPALDALQEGNTRPLDLTPYLLPSPNLFDGPYDTVMNNTMLRASGPLADLPAGPLILSALLERRLEEVQDGISTSINATSEAWEYSFHPRRSRNADSYYVELRTPLFSPRNARPGLRELELQVSMRHDSYDTISSAYNIPVESPQRPATAIDYTHNRLRSTDYTIGVRYAPVQAIAFRASYGTGFLPPAVASIVSDTGVIDFEVGLTDRQRDDRDIYEGIPISYISGGNPLLKPERSRSFSAGVIFTPDFMGGLRFSADYTHIRKTDEVRFLFDQFVLDNAALFPDRVRRGPKLETDEDEWLGPIVYLDVSLLNIATTSVQAFDFQADYTFDAGQRGSFHWYAIATLQQHYQSRVLPDEPEQEGVGYLGGPLRWRGNAGLNWDLGPWSVRWNAQFYDAHLAYPVSTPAGSIPGAIRNQGSATIPHQLYHDLIATYRFAPASAGRWLADAEVSVGIQNLFDTSPPIRASTDTVSAGYSTYGDPRLRRYSASFLKRF